jgi:eukaryotic-like serine/threonine-protein kinase
MWSADGKRVIYGSTFEGKSQLNVASAILEKEPEPITPTKPLAPPALNHAIRKCL